MTAFLVEFASDTGAGNPDRYDFRELGLPDECSILLAKAFRGVTENYRAVSRRQAWRSVRKFGKFLLLASNPDEQMQRANVLEEFAEYLRTHLLNKTSGSHLNLIMALYRWLAVFAEPQLRWLNIRAAKVRFTREPHCARVNNLSEQSLLRIGNACKTEIDQFRRNQEIRRSPARAEGVLSKREVEFLRICLELEEVGVHTHKDLMARGVSMKRRSLRAIAKYKEPSTRSLLPYLLLIHIATAANPWSVMNLQVDCLEDHPLDPLLVRFYWHKGRSSCEQFSDVLRSGTYAIPVLLDDVADATAPLRQIARDEFKRHVFIARVGKTARSPSVQGLHNALAEFRKQHDLPYFTFADIRRGLAQALAGRGESIEAVRRTLQHRSTRTTDRYLDSPRAAEDGKLKVLEYQIQILTAASKELGTISSYDTTYGFGCKDPEVGLAPGSRIGEPCLEFAHCAVCPNAIFIIDSAEHVARIMLARDALENHRARAYLGTTSLARFQHQFAPTLAIATKLLELVSDDVAESARKLLPQLPLFPLEE